MNAAAPTGSQNFFICLFHLADDILLNESYDPSLRHGETEQCEIRPQEVYRITIE